jgi:TonB family protein
MRKPATVVCVALALGGCSVREARTPGRVPRPAVSPASADDAPRYGARSPSGDGASRGSAAFGRYVRAHEPQLQFCYSEARASSPNLAGSATVSLTLATNGSVQSAEIVRRAWSGGKGSDVVERCVLSTVRAWNFPALDPKDEHVHSFAVIFTR